MKLGIILFFASILAIATSQNATIPVEITILETTTLATTEANILLTTPQMIVTTVAVTNSPVIVPLQEPTVIIATQPEVVIPIQDPTVPMPVPVPVPVEIVVPVVTTVQTTTTGTPTENDRCRLLTAIMPGDTFNDLARKHKVKVRDIIRANPLLIPNKLVVGSTVCIPK